ncbi:MAG: hypothetical protein H0W18_14205 [Acidobacteria bacterium]|nr:hypothetical protein [Acidobacteriota bacterium]
MPLTTGARLGPYEVIAAIGAGGMGEVYRARDTQLNRSVAIKVLPELRSGRRAALNHPNIAHIHGLEGDGSAGRPRALVMELVDGDDLSVLIARGPMPLTEALR